MSEPAMVELIYAHVEHGINRDGLDKKWKVDGMALVAKLRSLSFIENCALADAAERWWIRVANKEKVQVEEALAEQDR
ncbi:MAG: hypothetical protein L0220_31840 [Acidobacteria bacterium]|nr:hypothetical protein [Acidobacteriota bacterium]